MNAHFARGEALFNIKRYDQAVSAFHSALADDPNDAITHAMLGAALVNRQQTDAAHDAVRRALQIDPQSAYAHYVLSVVELQRLQFDLAEKAVAESLRLDQSADVLLQAATLAQINGRIEDALAFTDEALRLDPQHSQSILFRGKLLAGESRFDEAHALYASALANNPENAAAHHALGTLRLRSGDAPEALGMFREARRLDPVGTNDAFLISLAYGRMLGPVRRVNRGLMRWHLWTAQQRCLLFGALAVVLTIGATIARAHEYTSAFTEFWFLGCLLLSNYLTLPLSLEIAAIGAGQLALRRELHLSGAQVALRAHFLIPIIVLQLVACYLAITLIVPGIALFVCLLAASVSILWKDLQTQYARNMAAVTFVALVGQTLFGEIGSYLAALDRPEVSVVFVAAYVGGTILFDSITAAKASRSATA